METSHQAYYTNMPGTDGAAAAVPPPASATFFFFWCAEKCLKQYGYDYFLMERS